MRTTRWIVLVLPVAVLAGSCSTVSSFLDIVPPRSATHDTIWVMKQRVLRYVRQHNALPKSVNDLPEIPGKDNGVQDAWGREILMTFHDGRATLTSLGRDGRPGGQEDDADIYGTFPLKKSNGAWADENVDWIKEPAL